ncbi:MAG: MIP family channel protein [Bacilli bacterium]|nr:MIP family channel protein [Bacilli bacterium]
MKKYISEAIGTGVLVLIGCGVAVLSSGDLVATALAFGLAIVAMAYSVGAISGGHFNPAVTLGQFINKKISGSDAIFYVIAQIIGAFIGAGLLYVIFTSCSVGVGNLGANGFGSASGTDITLAGAILVEVILTFIFVLTVLFAANEKDNKFAGLVIGLALVLVHLIGIKLTGTSVNPARSLAPAAILGGTAFKQVWVFLLAPLIGAAIAGFSYKGLAKRK